MQWLVTSFDWRGSPKLLRDRRAGLKAVQIGQLTPSTQVTIRLSSGERQLGSAAKYPHLHDLFGDAYSECAQNAPAMQPEAVEEANPERSDISKKEEVTKSRKSSGAGASAVKHPTDPANDEALSSTLQSNDNDVLPPATQPDDTTTGTSAGDKEPDEVRPRKKPQGWVIGILIWLLLVFVMWPDTGKREVFALADTPIFTAKSFDSSDGRGVAYGDALTVSTVGETRDDADWLLITDGVFAGNYLPAGLVDEVAPPPIDRSQKNTFIASEKLIARIAPSPLSPILEQIGRGQKYDVQGTIAGENDERWYVVLLSANNLAPRVSYVQVPETQQREAKLEVLPKPKQAPTEKAKPTDSCLNQPTPYSRLICQNSAAGQYRREIINAHRDYCSKARQEGASCQPLSVFLNPLESCANVSCGRRIAAEQRELLGRKTDSIKFVAQSTPPPPPPSPRFTPKDPVPRGNPGGWVTPRDYPSRAVRDGREGITRFRVDVSAIGRATNCTVTGSSGHQDLDETTCKLISRRARFNPATDSNGNDVAGFWSSAIRWELPD